MANQTKPDANAVQEVAANEPADNQPQAEKTPAKGGNTGRVIALLFVVIALVFGALAAAGQLQPLFERVSALLGGAMHNSPQVSEPTRQLTHAATAAKPADTHATPTTPATNKPVVPPAHRQPDQSSVHARPADSTNVHSEPHEAAEIATMSVNALDAALTAAEPVALNDTSPGQATLSAPIDDQTTQPASAVDQTTQPAPADDLAILAAATRAAAAREEISRLTATIDQLSSKLEQMSQAQGDVANLQSRQQQAALQVRLNWLTDSNTGLKQMQQIWGEIVLLPGLTDDQRAQATRMHALASNSVQHIQQLQQRLLDLAEALSVPEYPELLPQPSHPWLAWIVGQFHLHKAPSGAAMHVEILRQRLQAASRQLAVGSWPEKSVWQALYADLLVQLQAEATSNGAADAGLPASLDGIQEQINRLRTTAVSWKNHGREGI